MRKNIYLTSFIVLIFLSNYSTTYGDQQWLRYYNDSVRIVNNDTTCSFDLLYAMDVDFIGNTYLTGYSNYGSSQRTVTVKVNSSGNIVWVYGYPRYYSSAIRIPSAITVDKFMNVNAAIMDFDNYNHYLIVKLNANGDSIWSADYWSGYGNNKPFSIAVDSNCNVYVTGAAITNINNGYDFVTIKYDSSGVQKWIRDFDGEYHTSDIPVVLKTDASGNVIISGISYRTSTDEDFCTIKYNSEGVFQWVKTLHYGFDDEVSDMILDTSGNIYVTGMINPTANTWEYCTIKYNPAGVQQWLSRYAGTNGYYYNCPYAIGLDKFGNVFVTGYTEKNYPLEDYATIKYSPGGDELWKAFYNGVSDRTDVASDLAVDSGGNCYVTGMSYDNGKYGYTTVKYDSSGVQQWSERIEPAGTVTDYYPFMGIDGENGVYVSGTGLNGRFRYDYVLAKYQTIVGQKTSSSEIPQSYFLSQNYPNPFNPITKIKFGLPSQTHARLIIYDVLGREIVVLTNEVLKAGEYSFDWNALGYPSGVYFYSLIAGDYIETRKMVLLK